MKPPLQASRHSILFLVTEDWFFRSHFLPLIRAAHSMGFHAVVVTRVREDRALIEAAGARVIALEADRSSLNPVSVLKTLVALRRILKQEKPDILHCIALRSILLGGVAARFASVSRRVYALTGLGFLGARKDRIGRLSRRLVGFVLRNCLGRSGVTFLFENPDDPKSLSLQSPRHRIAVIGGAGVDPSKFTVSPLPSQPPLKIAIVSRMLWSKGVDLVVEAVGLARAQGADVTLSLYGAPDPANPKAIPEATLQLWNSQPGISWKGPTRDISGVWALHHVACLASRGGEGLPRTLLEAAACERAIVTTDVPGCRSFIRNSIEGYMVPPNNAQALAEAFMRLSRNPQAVEAMGKAVHTRLKNGFTEQDVIRDVKAIYKNLLD